MPNPESVVSVYAVDAPPAECVIERESLKNRFSAAICARAESLTALGAMPSAQLIVLSAVALIAAVVDHV